MMMLNPPPNVWPTFLRNFFFQFFFFLPEKKNGAFLRISWKVCSVALFCRTWAHWRRQLFIMSCLCSWLKSRRKKKRSTKQMVFWGEVEVLLLEFFVLSLSLNLGLCAIRNSTKPSNPNKNHLVFAYFFLLLHLVPFAILFLFPKNV